MLGCYPGDDWYEELEAAVEEHAQHAGAYAARVLPTLGHESRFYIHHVTSALFVALARSGTPIPEAADHLFPIAWDGGAILHVRVVEAARALPPGRRERAIIGSMQRSDGRASWVLAGVAAVLAAIPMPEVREAALAYAKKKAAAAKGDGAVKREIAAIVKALR